MENKFYCENCGKEVDYKYKFCKYCGNPLSNDENTIEDIKTKKNKDEKRSIHVGYSPKINDPAFKKYLKNTYQYSFFFALTLAIIALVGFYIYGETSYEMNNPEALYIGIAIGSMFLLIGMSTMLGRKRSKTWDGVVTKKEILDKTRNKKMSDDNQLEYYKVYNVIILSENNKEVTIRVEDDDTVYKYYKVGDKVRHHGGLNSYEKYDKSKDSIIFCNACASLNDINDEKCFRCSCPLLK